MPYSLLLFCRLGSLLLHVFQKIQRQFFSFLVIVETEGHAFQHRGSVVVFYEFQPLPIVNFEISIHYLHHVGRLQVHASYFCWVAAIEKQKPQLVLHNQCRQLVWFSTLSSLLCSV